MVICTLYVRSCSITAIGHELCAVAMLDAPLHIDSKTQYGDRKIAEHACISMKQNDLDGMMYNDQNIMATQSQGKYNMYMYMYNAMA